ncbi:MAG: hypothetical protein IJV98_05385 [Clostridia bacterium]|nr:hypothetical protein [Clostridia bacterium]
MSKLLKWLDNYWYHYKWTTIVVVFFLSLAIILGIQFATKENYDAYIMYVGDEAIPDTKRQDIVSSFGTVMQDYNGDKEIILNFSRTAFISDEEHEMASTVNAAATQFLSSMSVQPYYIYLMTPLVYDIYKDSGVFVPISELEIDIPEEWYYDEQTVLFSKTDFARSHAGVDSMGEDLILAIKSVPYSRSSRVEKNERLAFENHYDLLKTILEYRK